jgi:hypothetical protein
VLDSWVRYEGQVKQRQQRELAETIIGKVQKELENPKVLQQILQQSVQDIESKLCRCEIIVFWKHLLTLYRNRAVEGAMSVIDRSWATIVLFVPFP